MRLRPIVRVPTPGLDPDDGDRVFAALTGELEREARRQRPPIPELRLFFPGTMLRVPLEQMTWPGFEPQMAEIFRGLGAALGARRRYRLSVLNLEMPPDVHEGIGLLEWDGAAYHAAVLPLHGEGPARVPDRGWRVLDGADPAALPPPFRRQLDPAAPQPENPWPPGREAPLNATVRPLPIPPPPRPDLLAQVLVQDVLQEILGRGLDQLEAFVFRPREVERWAIRRGLPVSIHEVLRTLAGKDAVGIVLVQPTLVELGDQVHHAALFHAEIAGQRGGVCVPLEVVEGAAPRPLRPQVFRGGPPGPDAWIGVPPRVKLDLAPVGGMVD